MNAGTRIGEIGDRVAFVRVMMSDGSIRNLTPDELSFEYRRGHLPSGSVVTRVGLWVSKDTHRDERRHREEHLEYRKASQPLDQPSCGSTFKNPPGDAAGRLIDAAGLKGTAIGGAQISEKHANFFINTGDATAADLYALIRLARETVREQFAITLEPEVHAVGDWPEGMWPL